jgi:hypothetical protein
MPDNLVKRRFKKKRRSCALCKPHKMNGADRRKVSDKRADESLRHQLVDV